MRVQYGGSFDPVHNGHLAVAEAAAQALSARIWLMPAADPPHKPPTQADARQRADMLALAIAGRPQLALDTRELEREGPSYTIDTLLGLRAELGPEAPLAILIGADSFVQLPGWRRWRELAEHAHIVIARRPGVALDADALAPALAAFARGRWADGTDALSARPAGLLLELDLPLRPESASQVRRSIAAGQPWREMVPPVVADYIALHGLYRDSRDNGARYHPAHPSQDRP